ncbi:MAG: hypothetical protein AB7U82_20205 [Blastocatellales bacterium]
MISIRHNNPLLLFALTGAIIISVAPAALAQARGAPQPQSENQRAAGQRIAPPSALKCSRNHLTSFMGRVTSYQRSQTRIFIRVRTDEQTTESFTLKFTKNDDPAKLFLMRGEEFKQSDWKLIEVSTGRLRKPMRAIVWVCDDGSNPVIDWRPPEK